MPTEARATSVRLTHPDRVLYAQEGITKRELASHLARVAPLMLPHVADRPLMLVRCPEGRDAGCFVQKHPSRGLPATIARVPIAERRQTLDSMYVTDVAGLVGLAQLGALEVHAWGSRVQHLERPDQLVFDLDPDEGLPWKATVAAAHELRERLSRLDLTPFLKTTGGKGLHVVVPVVPELEWDAAKAFCKRVVETMVRASPRRFVATASKEKRRGKVFLDYLRNARGATAIAPYSTRAKPSAPVAMPIAWTELDADLRPEAFTLRSVAELIGTRARDPWTDFEAARANLLDFAARAAVARRALRPR